MYASDFLGGDPARWTTGLLGKIAAASGSTLLNDLVAYWPLDEVSGTRYDAVGSNDLTDNNTVGVSLAGPSGTVAKFVATSSESLTATSTNFQKASSDWAFAGWAKIDAYVVYDPFFGTWGSNEGLGIYQGGSTPLPGGYGALVYVGVEELFAAADAPLLGQGTWNFIVASFNSAAGELSVSTNGAAYVTKSPASPTSRTSDFWIGGVGTYFSDTTIGPVAWWTRQLTTEDVTSLFNSGTAKAYADLTTAEKVGLVSYWNLDEASGQRNDSHGTNHLTDNNTVGSVVNAGAAVHNGAASFVNANNENLSVTAADLAAAGADWSSAFWAYHTNQDYAVLCGTYTGISGFGVFSRNNNSVDYYLHYSAGDRVIINAACTPNAWHHIYVQWVHATKTAGISIDGGSLSTAATTDGYSAANPSVFKIGGGLTGVIALTGLVDEPAFWSRVLTSDERTELWNLGKGKYYDFSS